MSTLAYFLFLFRLFGCLSLHSCFHQLNETKTFLNVLHVKCLNKKAPFNKFSVLNHIFCVGNFTIVNERIKCDSISVLLFLGTYYDLKHLLQTNFMLYITLQNIYCTYNSCAFFRCCMFAFYNTHITFKNWFLKWKYHNKLKNKLLSATMTHLP